MKLTPSRRVTLAALTAALLVGGSATVAAQNGDSAAAAPAAQAATAASAAKGTAAKAPRDAAALTGRAKLYRSLGDDITFSFDARLAAKDTKDPRKAKGTFRFSHYAKGEGAWAEAEVDCLITGDKVAVVTGVVVRTDLKGAKGRRVGVTVHDRPDGDRLGYSWAASPLDSRNPLAPCVSSAPFEKVRAGTGDFRVLPWQPKL
ncbi:Repetin [Streptomyces yaizuensis]|uniref:Repetin n=1 Tax=Streptomyces yaizuensis TaxID=2989713 RepID=A0ABQ5P1D7_9ACTN|nr:Repetin [Streptomyces sp. YSPA8]GLF96422.1 Repetin [Streptomyces sp. YSPA8]